MKMRDYRTRTGLTQVEWAKLVGCSERTVIRIEAKSVKECSKATRAMWQITSKERAR